MLNIAKGNNIKLKWLIPCLLLLTNLSLIVVNLAYTIDREIQHIKEDYAERLNRSMTRLQHTVEYALKKDHQEWVQKEISAHGADPTLIEMFLIDAEFEILASSQRVYIGDNAKQYYKSSAPELSSTIVELINTANSEFSNKTYVASEDNQVVCVFPISIGVVNKFLHDHDSGALIARIDLADVVEKTKAHAIKNLLFISTGLMLLTILFVIFLNSIVSRRLSKITDVTQRIASGDFKADSGVYGKDEIGELGVSVSKMSQLLQANKEQLEQELAGRALAENQVRELNKELELHIEELKLSNQKFENKAIELERISKFKSEFLANMSHELRTPLNSIIGFTQRLLVRYGDKFESRAIDSLETIHKNGKHLLLLINDLLDFSKIEAGKLEISKQPINLTDILEETKKAFEPAAEDKSLFLNVGAAPDIKFEADEKRFKQILYNLISNAIKFTDQGGVSVETAVVNHNSNSMLSVVVRDSGIGINKDDLPRLFLKFEQLDDADTNNTPGTGLGLVLAKELTELHGGTINVQSEKGKGTEFTLLFPILS